MAPTTTTATGSDPLVAPPSPTPARRSRAGMWIALGAAAVLVVAIIVAVWGTSTGPSSSTTSAKIKTSWETFFLGSTPVATRVRLVQDGAALQAVLAGEAHSGFARGLAAKVTKVTVTSPTTAAVTYTILVGGTPLLSDQTGQAVKISGTWVVSVKSFCSLLSFQSTTLPAVCR